MKIAPWSVVFGLAVLGSAAAADPSRSSTLFDFDWRFALNGQFYGADGAVAASWARDTKPPTTGGTL